MGRRLPGAVGSVLVAACALLACGGSDYAYVSNTEDHVFFKVPEDWAIFDTEEVLGEAGGGTWLRGFSSDPHLAPELLLGGNSTAPRGYALVSRLSATERDTMSFVALRSTFGDDAEGKPIDPIALVRDNPDGGVQVLDYEEFDDEHARGIRIRLSVQTEEDEVIIDQTVMVDSGTSRRYMLSLGCRSACWAENEDAFEEVAGSWTVEKRS
jgi:hypothetical protein